MNGKTCRGVVGSLILIALLPAFSPRYRATAAPQHTPCCGPITPAGDLLSSTLDSMDVESLWRSHEHVNWETGEPDRGANDEGPGRHTHCSAFAAAAAKKLGVYLLRPPEHGQVLLANAQADWLMSGAAQQAGWSPVADARSAQRRANEGALVVVVFQSPDRHIPGHIAIVRPSRSRPRLWKRTGRS